MAARETTTCKTAAIAYTDVERDDGDEGMERRMACRAEAVEGNLAG